MNATDSKDKPTQSVIEQNLRFLAEASKILSSSLDYQTTLETVAKLAVTKVSDWCTIDMFDEKGELKHVAVAHNDPKKVKWAKELQKTNPPPDMNAPTGLPNVIRTGQSELYPEISEELLIKSARSKKELNLLRKVGLTSVMIVPLRRGGKSIGAITFITAETSRHYNHSDLAMAEELASRASLAIDNALLYKGSQDAIALRDDFISVASHELKTPITSIKIFTQVLQQHFQHIGDKKSQKYLEKMDNQLNKLTELIYNMLDISKIQAGRIEFNEKLFSFDKVILDMVDMLQQTSDTHLIRVLGHTEKKIYGDDERIGQVLANMISNAIKYSPTASEVLVRLSTDSENVIVCVEDKGVGIPNEHLQKIFERFYRVFDNTDKTFPGLGIGLYISAEIIKRHHGKFWVESKPKAGSKFYFSLPLKRKATVAGMLLL